MADLTDDPTPEKVDELIAKLQSLLREYWHLPLKGLDTIQEGITALRKLNQWRKNNVDLMRK
jgi:hypothetical protein